MLGPPFPHLLERGGEGGRVEERREEMRKGREEEGKRGREEERKRGSKGARERGREEERKRERDRIARQTCTP